MKIDGNKLEMVFKQLNNFVSKNDVRPVLKGIHVSYECDGVITFEACDSFVMNSITINVLEDDENKVDMVIEPIKFKADEFGVVAINFNDMYIEYSNGRRVSLNEVKEVNYPSLQNLAPKSDVKTEILFSVKALLNAIKGLDKQDVVTFKIYGETKPVVLETSINKNEFTDNTIIVSPCRKYV